MIQSPDILSVVTRLSNESDAYVSGFLQARSDAVSYSPAYQRLISILKKIIDRSYTDEVDRFLKVNVDDLGNVSGYFLDGSKTIEFALKKNSLSTKLARIRNDSLVVRLDKKKRNCQKGHPCKGSCIAQNKTCLAKLGEIASSGEVAQLRQAAVNLKLEQNAANKPPETPQPPKQNYETNPETGNPYTIRELKKVASAKGVRGYSSMTTEELKQSIKFLDETPPEQQQRIARTIASDRSTGNRAIRASGVAGKPKRNLQESNRTWKNLQKLAKFAGSQPVGWGAAAIGAFLLGASIRSYERAKGEYRSHFKEAAEEAQEKAANLGSSKNGLIQRTPKNNITFVISAGKGAGSEAIQKEFEKYKDSEDQGDNWLANNQHFIPFNLKESGAKPDGNDIENSVNGLTDYLTNFKRGKDQDAVDLAAQIYAYGIQRKQPESVATGLRKIQGRYENLVKQEGKLQSRVENLQQLLERETNPIQKRVIESRLAIAQSATQKAQNQKRNNRVAYAKLERDGDKRIKPELANKGKNINILAHSRAGQTSKTAMEYLARMQLPGEPTGKEVLEQVNLVMLGTPHFGFTENVSKRQRTLISAQDPISILPVFGEGARQQWVSTVKGHGWEDYLAEPRAREAIREVFGYYEDSLLERRRREKKKRDQRDRGDSEHYSTPYQETLTRLDAKKAVCKTGKPCKTKFGRVICIPKSHKCASDSQKAGLAQSKLPFYQDRNFQIGLAAAGVSTLLVGGALVGATALIKHDLKKSSIDFDSIRQPPGGIPDKETLAKYDTFKPGDLIRKNFKSARMGSRSHYAVYVGKDPKTGEHTLIDTGEDWKSRDSVPYVRSMGLTWNAGPNDTEYEKVPSEEMNLVKGAKQLSQEEIVERSQKMLHQTFKYEGFESNCEAFARAMVEGKAYSSQGQKVSPLTNFASRIVTDKVLTLRTIAEGDKAKAFNTSGETVIAKIGPYQFTGISDYGKDKYKMTAQQMAEYLEREAVMSDRRKWEEKANPYSGAIEKGYLTNLQETEKEKVKAQVVQEQDKNLIARNTIKPFNRFAITARIDRINRDSEVEDFLVFLGVRSPQEFSKIVEQITSPFGEMQEPMQVDLYKNYLLMLFALLNQDLETKADSYLEGFNSVRSDKVECTKGKPCKTKSGGVVCIPKSNKCASEDKDNTKDNTKRNLAIAGGGLLVGAGAVGAYAAARDILTTIDTGEISRDSLSVIGSEESKSIKVGKALDSQGATSKVYFASDASNRKFIFKQSEKFHYYQAASEVVVSDMAEKAGVKANKTRLIPIDVEHPNKDSGRAATLHSLVPGKELSKVQKEGLFQSVSLSQRNGLNEKIINSISQHPDLPKIAALDTFTGNWDRNEGNYFYDKESDNFNAIDLGVSYSRISTQHASVARKTRDNIRNIDFQRLDDREKKALNNYTQTLKSLYTNNPPEEIVKQHAKYLKLAGGDWDIFRRYVSVKQIFDDHQQVGRLIYDLEKKSARNLDSFNETMPRSDGRGKKCGRGYIPADAECNQGHSQQENKGSKISNATKRIVNSFGKTREVAKGLISKEDAPKVIRKANRKIENSILESIKEDPELLNQLIDSAKRNPDLVKGIIELQIGEMTGTFIKAAIKDPESRKLLAKLAAKPKIHQSVKDLVKESVDYIVRKDSEASDSYISGFATARLEALIKTDAKGKRCGKGYIPLIENLPTAVEIAADKTSTRKQRTVRIAGAAVTLSNQKAVNKLRNYANQ